MNPEQFLDLQECEQVSLRNGDGAVYIIHQKHGYALLVAHVALILKDKIKEWCFLNERQVERLEDMSVGMQVARRHPNPEYHIITEVNHDYAIAVRTPFVRLRNAESWVCVVGGRKQSAILVDAVGPEVASGVGKISPT